MCPVVGMGLLGEIVFGLRRVGADGGIGKGRGGAEAIEFVERAVEGALDAGLVARKVFYGAGAGGVVGEGAGAGIEVVVVGVELRHADIEEAGFEGAEAAQSPGGHGHLLDEQGFAGADGLVFGKEGVADFAEFLGILVGEDGGLSGESVAKGVVGDGGATFGRARAGAALGVAAIGVELSLGKHRLV